MYNGQFKQVLPGMFDRQETIKQVFCENRCFQIERQYYYYPESGNDKFYVNYIVSTKKKDSMSKLYLYAHGTIKIFYSYPDALEEVKRRVLSGFYF